MRSLRAPTLLLSTLAAFAFAAPAAAEVGGLPSQPEAPPPPPYAPAPAVAPPSYAPGPLAASEPSPSEIPPPDDPPLPRAKRNNLPMMIAGILLTGAGGASVIAGGTVMYVGAVTPSRGDTLSTGAGIMLGGLAGLAVGLPLLIVGGRRARGSSALLTPTREPASSAWMVEPTASGWVLRF
jgi:hypothetical protein